MMTSVLLFMNSKLKIWIPWFSSRINKKKNCNILYWPYYARIYEIIKNEVKKANKVKERNFRRKKL